MLEGSTAETVADRLTSFACQQVLDNLKFSFPGSFGDNVTHEPLELIEHE